MGLLATSQFHYRVPRVEVSQDLVFSFQSNEGGRAVTSVGRLYSWCSSMEKSIEDRRVDATGCVGPSYPTFVVFSVLGPRGIVVI
jgi:hypothetical protein